MVTLFNAPSPICICIYIYIYMTHEANKFILSPIGLVMIALLVDHMKVTLTLTHVKWFSTLSNLSCVFLTFTWPSSVWFFWFGRLYGMRNLAWPTHTSNMGGIFFSEILMIFLLLWLGDLLRTLYSQSSHHLWSLSSYLVLIFQTNQDDINAKS